MAKKSNISEATITEEFRRSPLSISPVPIAISPVPIAAPIVKPVKPPKVKQLDEQDLALIFTLVGREVDELENTAKTHVDEKIRSAALDQSNFVNATLGRVQALFLRAEEKARARAKSPRVNKNTESRVEAKAKRVELLAEKKRIKRDMKAEIMQRASEAIAEIDSQLRANSAARKAKRA